MKYAVLLLAAACFSASASAQKKPAPAQQDPNKIIQETLKKQGMSDEEVRQMQKLMQGNMPAGSQLPIVDEEFTDNKVLVPARNAKAIAAVPKVVPGQKEVLAMLGQLYGTVLPAAPAAERDLVSKISASRRSAQDLHAASVVCFLQGHQPAALALAIKAVQADPANPTFQNNVAAMLIDNNNPEKAVPLLRKLMAEDGDNSTLLHNMGMAWFNMGETDSARVYIRRSMDKNPHNPESQLCGGVLEEIDQNTDKATEHYNNATDHSLDGFSTKVSSNASGQEAVNRVSYEQIKDRIGYYEYFKREDFRIPVFSDQVSGYAMNSRLRNGFDAMYEKLTEKLDSLGESYGADLRALGEKNETEFVTTMFKQTTGGINVMSKAAANITMIQNIYMVDWMQRYNDEYQALRTEIEETRKRMATMGANDDCKTIDEKNNAFLQYANPKIREHYNKKIDEYIQWLNIYLTWSPYIVNNPLNTNKTNCLTYTKTFFGIFMSGVTEQWYENSLCSIQDGDGSIPIEPWDIPEFCPRSFTILMGGKELFSIMPQLKNFDGNSFGVTKGGSMPNATLAMSAGKGEQVPEAGKYGAPFIKTGDESAFLSNDNDELTPLTKIQDELAPLRKILDPLTPLDRRLLNGNLSVKDEAGLINSIKARRKMRLYMLQQCEEPKAKRNEEKDRSATDQDQGKDRSANNADEGKDANAANTSSNRQRGASSESQVDEIYRPRKLTVRRGELTFEDIPEPPTPEPPKGIKPSGITVRMGELEIEDLDPLPPVKTRLGNLEIEDIPSGKKTIIVRNTYPESVKTREVSVPVPNMATGQMDEIYISISAGLKKPGKK